MLEKFYPDFAKQHSFWPCFVAYTLLGVIPRALVSAFVQDSDGLCVKKRGIWGSYPASLVHATACVCLAYAVVFGHATMELFISNSTGYFISDAIVDHDPEYIVHHISTLLVPEFCLRRHLDFTPILHAFWVTELGNVVAHSASILLLRTGLTFKRINAISFWISRPLGFLLTLRSWWLVPWDDLLTSIGILTQLGVVVLNLQQTKWLLAMLGKLIDAPVETANVDSAHPNRIKSSDLRLRT